MLRMYTHVRYIPKGIKVVRSNDAEFIFKGAIIEDTDIVKKALEEVENAKYFDRKRFIGRFGGYAVSSMNLSTGCKTILNIIREPETCFLTVECGYNVFEFIYKYLDGIILLSHYDTFVYNDGREYEINDISVSSYAEYKEVFDDAND